MSGSTVPECDGRPEEHEVSRRTGGLIKEFRHPGAGTLVLNQVILHPAETPDLPIVTLQPVPGTGTAQRLARLSPPMEAFPPPRDDSVCVTAH